MSPGLLWLSTSTGQGIAVRLSWLTTVLTAATLASSNRAAAEAKQFNLECLAQSRVGAHPWQDYRAPLKFQIDLDHMQWCRDDCSVVRLISEVTASRITLETPDPHAADPRLTIVDRQNGAFTSTEVDGDPIQERGVCKPVPFTPFPKTLF